MTAQLATSTRELCPIKITDKVVAEWDISNFVTSHYNIVIGNVTQRQDEIVSPTFWLSGTSEWCMGLHIQGRDLLMCFHLLSSQADPSVSAEVSAWMFKQNGTTVASSATLTISLIAPKTFKAILLPFDKCCLKNIILRGEVSVISETSEPILAKAPIKDLQSVVDDLGALLRSGDLSDVVLCAGESELRAHRLVLSARSPVFAAMLRHDSKEAQTGRVDIPDVDADTLRELLHYCYTGHVPCLAAMASRLLVAADKYQLVGLKRLCEQQLVKDLAVDNATDAAVLALTHSGCELLRRAAIRFMQENLTQVLGSDGWADAVMHHACSAVEISRLIAAKTAKEVTTEDRSK